MPFTKDVILGRNGAVHHSIDTMLTVKFGGDRIVIFSAPDFVELKEVLSWTDVPGQESVAVFPKCST